MPFGGGLDSIVSVELLRARGVDAALFVVNRPGDRFAAIEEPAAGDRAADRPGRAADRRAGAPLAELGFRNGHVPVTAIISGAAILAAALDGRDAVVMSNEWSASSATLVVDGREINHQYSKSEAFEADLRSFLGAADAGLPDYFSLLRPFSELWIAARFAEHPAYLAALPQLQPGVPHRPGQALGPLVRRVRQVLLHRPDPGAVPAAD